VQYPTFLYSAQFVFKSMHCTVVVIVVAIVGAAVVAAAEHNPQLKGQFNNTEGYSLVQYPTFLY
jgi:hypothetical protein